MIAGVAHGNERQSALARVEADQVHRRLDRDRVDVGEHDIHQLHIVEVHLGRFRKVIVQAKLTDLVHLLGAEVREYGDNAQRTQRHEGNGLVVVAGVDIQLVAAERTRLRNGGDIAVRFLGRDNVLMLAQLRVGLGLDVAAGTRRHVIQDQRQVDIIRDGGEMADRQRSQLGILYLLRHEPRPDAGGGVPVLHPGGKALPCALQKMDDKTPFLKIQRDGPFVRSAQGDRFFVPLLLKNCNHKVT